MKIKKMVEELFGAVGIIRWIESEEDLDAVTAISGSGPAYFFLFAELIEKAAIQIGLDQNWLASCLYRRSMARPSYLKTPLIQQKL